MRRSFVFILALSLVSASLAHAGLLDDLEKKSRELTGKKKSSGGELDSNTIIAGLKEALSIGAQNGVKLVSREDGYFGNQLIRILVPEKIQKTAKLLRKAGFGKEVDKFELSMNRAAEKAGPRALAFFIDAIREMSIPDAVKILRGKDTEATEYLRAKTYERIYGVFKPVVSSAMNDVGVTRSFKEMMDKTKNVPLLKKESVDLDHYVTSKALDGLFLMVGQEEKKIRKDPVARVTDLLKKVFR
jgi:hypothetical protein